MTDPKTKAGKAHDLMVIAQARAHDLKNRAKTAEHGLRGLLQRCQRVEAERDALAKDAERYRAKRHQSFADHYPLGNEHLRESYYSAYDSNADHAVIEKGKANG